MSGDVIHARVSAVKEIGHGVASYGTALSGALASARADLNRAAAEFQLVIADSQRRVSAAEHGTEMAAAALARCRERCEPLQRDLAEAKVAQQEAKRRHERNRHAQTSFERISAELYSSMRTVQTDAEKLVPAGRQRIEEYAEILTSYLKTEVSG